MPDFQPLPTLGLNEFIQRLLPDGVRLVPLSTMGGMLLAYLLVPGVHWAQHEIQHAQSRLKDDILMENFRQHEREFHQLAAMYVEDQRPHYICTSGRNYPKLSSERFEAYRTLMATARVEYGIEREKRGAVLFRYWAVSGTIGIARKAAAPASFQSDGGRSNSKVHSGAEFMLDPIAHVGLGHAQAVRLTVQLTEHEAAFESAQEHGGDLLGVKAGTELAALDSLFDDAGDGGVRRGALRGVAVQQQSQARLADAGEGGELALRDVLSVHHAPNERYEIAQDRFVIRLEHEL